MPHQLLGDPLMNTLALQESVEGGAQRMEIDESAIRILLHDFRGCQVSRHIPDPR